MRNIIAITALSFVILLMAVLNYQPDTWLTGWDNLHPEFNFTLNIKRSLFSVWQEYQGLGLLGGMGHAADLPRQIILWALSFVIPVHLLRYTWTFGMLGLGGFGCFFLLKKILDKNLHMHSFVKNSSALIGSLFYLTNLATVQMFHTPFEAFTTHFGFLPWLIFFFLSLLHNPTKKTLFLFSLFSLLSTTQGYVQTIFLVYIMTLAAIAMIRLMQARTRICLQRIIIAVVIILATNAFWLLPNIYFTITKTNVVREAKINQMATDEIYERNRAYGSLVDTIQLKGFWFDTWDFNPSKSQTAPILNTWREQANTPIAKTIAFILFLVILMGVGTILQKSNRESLWTIGIFLLGITMLTTATPPLSWINDGLRQTVPLFYQVFRFPFTKFSIVTGLSYSLLLGIGLTQLFKLFHSTIAKNILLGLIIAVMGITSYPIFQGYLFYPAVKQIVPQDYFDLFSFLHTQPKNARIANLPQSNYWGWTYAQWGYSGSGFLWYGIEQPIVDRAFDVWGSQNENYYWELSRALYSKDASALEAVFAKYDIHYALLDENLISASNDRSLFIDETKALIAKIPTITIARSFGKITVYERINETEKSFVSLKANLPTVSPVYRWTDNDVAYQNLGDYITDSSCQVSRVACHVFPFRSLFTKRSIGEREFTITETDTMLTIGDTSQATTASTLKHDALVFEATNSATLNPQAVVPCGIAGKGIVLKSTIGSSSASDTGNQTIKPDQFLRFTNNNQRGCLSFDVPQLPHKDSYLVAVESRHVTGRPLLLAFINDTARHAETETYLDHSNSKKVKPFSLDKKDLTFSGQWQTDYFILPQLAPDGLGYTVYLSNDAIGKQETINDIKSIRFYGIPYQELVTLHSAEVQPLSTETQPQGPALSVDHPNPAFYKISFQPSTVSGQPEQTLILSQSFDPGWLAFTKTTTFPFLKPLQDHVLVNNWSNGWRIKLSAISCLPRSSGQEPSAKNNKLQAESCPLTAVIFFWPQLLEWFGFLLLPIPFMLTYLPKLFRPTHTLQST